MMKHETELELKPPSLWRSRIIFAGLVSICFVGLLLATGVLWRTFLSDPPVTIEPANTVLKRAVCPGDKLDIRSHIEVKEATILRMYVSVLDAKADFNYPHTGMELTPRLHPHPSKFIQTIPWTVPQLMPGSYVRVLAVRGHDFNQDPLFTFFYFTIREDCPNGTSNPQHRID